MSNDKDSDRPIIKKIIKKKAGHHGGSWKIAYADFVTAMMAFFMLLWLLSLLNKYQQQGISNYFKKPLKDVFVYNKQSDTPVPQTPAENTKPFPLAEAAEKPNTSPKGEMNQASGEQQEMEKLKKELQKSLKANPEFKEFEKVVDFEVGQDGLKIKITDLEDKPMFSLGKTDFEKYSKNLIKWLGSEINKHPYKITVIGFTDTKSYGVNANYTNWELSTERANATRRYLVINGVDEKRFIRIQGAGPNNLWDKKDGEDPSNRRIEIILLTDTAAKKMLDN